MPYIANPLEGIPLVNTFITDQASLGAAAALDDTLIIYDISATALKQLTMANLQAGILVSSALTGTPTAPTQSAGNDTTRIATTAFVTAANAALNTITEMTDVTISSIASGEVLKWNGSAWINNTIAELGVLTVAGPTFTGVLTVGSAVISEADLEQIDDLTAGTAVASKVVTTDSNIDTTGQRNLTISGELDAATLDISGNADIDGTLEADIITVDGVALSTYIRDTVGTNMLSSNTESGIAVTYDTSNDNIDFALETAQTSLVTIYNAGLKVGRDSQNNIDFSTDNKIIFQVNGVEALMWSDLFLANGGVINFYNGNLTITHSSNTLTVAGGTFATGALTTTTIVASDRIKTDSTSDASTTLNGSLQTDGGLSVVKDAVFGNNVSLLSDHSELAFGLDRDVVLVHEDGTGLKLNGTNKLTFFNTNQFIQGSNSTTLSLAGAAEIDLTATLIDINGNADISGTTTFNTVAYSWPSSQGAASTNLQNNGSGALTWVAASAGVSMDVILTLGA